MRTLIIATMLALLLSACAAPVGPQAQKETTTIGAILTLTGWGAYWGESAAIGIEFAEQDINEKFERTLKVIIEDSQTSNNGAIAAANKLLNVDRTDAIYVEFSGPSAAISDMVEHSNKVMLFNALPPQILEENPYALKTYFDARSECKRLAQAAHERGLTRQAILLLDLPFAEPCESGILEAKEELDFEIVHSGRIDYDEVDFRSSLVRIEDAGADVIIGIFYEDHAINLLKQKFELDLDLPLYCGGKNDCLTTKVLESVPEASLEGATTFNFEISEEFVERYLGEYPGATEVELQAAALAYDGISRLYFALESCENPSCVIAQIQEIDYDGQVNGKGFNAKRVLEMESRLETFGNGTFVPVGK